MAKKKMDHSLYMTAGIACVAIVVIVLIVLGIGGNLGFGTGDLAGQATKGMGGGGPHIDTSDAQSLFIVNSISEDIDSCKSYCYLQHNWACGYGSVTAYFTELGDHIKKVINCFDDPDNVYSDRSPREVSCHCVNPSTIN